MKKMGRIRLLLFTAAIALAVPACSMLGGGASSQQQQAAATLCAALTAANPQYAAACTLLGSAASPNPPATNTLPPLAGYATSMICSANSTDPHIIAGCLILQSMKPQA